MIEVLLLPENHLCSLGDDVCAQSCSGDRLIPVTGLFRHAGQEAKKKHTAKNLAPGFPCCVFFIASDLQPVGTGRYEICDGLCDFQSAVFHLGRRFAFA